MLKVKKLSKVYKSGGRDVQAIDNVNLELSEGRFVSIIGRSGSGKSTLLNLLGGLDKPTTGEIIVDGIDITNMSDHALISYRGQKIGFIFQSYNLVPNLSAVENVMLPMEFIGVPKSERYTRAINLLEQVGFTNEEIKRKPSRLSGGQQQRVAIARALANKPKLILADEPTGNLDSHTGKIIFELLKKLSKSQKTTIIVVTHDLEIAQKTDQTYNLKDGKLKK
jgi:putative ABC transport system ATP-binding protein